MDEADVKNPPPGQERRAREAAALRANLLRRKQQARSREAAETQPLPEPERQDR